MGKKTNEPLFRLTKVSSGRKAKATDCELWVVGEEFSRKPYALAVQEGSPLKNELSSKYVTT